MYPQNESVTLLDNVTPVTITSSTDATPIVVTATAHGLLTGQRVLIFGHTTNVAANGIFKIGVTTTNTFQLLDEITGVAVAGSGAGAGSSGICLLAPTVLKATGFRNVILQIGTSGTATTTLKVAGSLGKTAASALAPRSAYPNIGATQVPANPWSYLASVNLDTGATLAGSTGVVVAGTDINNMWEVNINAIDFLTVIPISWSAGAITIKALLVTNA